jgi:endoribonuclease Dicer
VLLLVYFRVPHDTLSFTESFCNLSTLGLQIVEALTTSRCLEDFSLEGLELLGDSFLKYAQSSYLFLEYAKKHEGQLSARRCREICNAKLHTLAIDRKLPVGSLIHDGLLHEPRSCA